MQWCACAACLLLPYIMIYLLLRQYLALTVNNSRQIHLPEIMWCFCMGRPGLASNGRKFTGNSLRILLLHAAGVSRLAVAAMRKWHVRHDSRQQTRQWI